MPSADGRESRLLLASCSSLNAVHVSLSVLKGGSAMIIVHFVTEGKDSSLGLGDAYAGAAEGRKRYCCLLPVCLCSRGF